MAVLEYLSYGTKAEGNNAAVTPALPSNPAWTPATGDTVFVIGVLRENGGTLSITAGWTLIDSQAHATGESYVAVWYKAWASGMTAPTVTPSGGGSNDTVVAQTFVLRGPWSSISTIMKGSVPTSGDAIDVSTLTNGFDTYDGSVLLLVGGYSNDTTAISYNQHIETAAIYPKWNGGQFAASTLGSDAALAWNVASFDTATTGISSSYIRSYLSSSPNTDAVYIWIHIRGDAYPPPPSYTGFADILMGARLDDFEFIGGANYVGFADILMGARLDDISTVPANPWLVYGITPSWNMEGLPANMLLEGWEVVVKINGVARPVSQLNIRRTGDRLTINSVFPGYYAPAVGATLDLEIVYHSSGGAMTTIPIASTLITYALPATEASSIISEVDGQPASSAEWLPKRVIYRSTHRVRTEVDWYVRVGDSYDGMAITDVVTVLGNSSPWFTEVGYG